MDDRLRIWEGYREFKKLAYVVRSGFGYSGIYPISNADLRPKKGRKPLPESDLEHVAGVMKLVRLISWYYPEIVPKERIDDFLFGAEIHEMGEIVTGDTMDDGTRNESDKDILETFEVKNYLRVYAPSEESARGIKIFEEMRDKKTDFGKTLYFIDKLEAILQAIFYESMGRPGRLYFKEKYFGGISERDKTERAHTGSDYIVDIWTYAFIQKAHQLDFKHTDTFLSIIERAVLDVRQKPFSWID